MNCKPGDLAYVVGDIPEAGLVVTVVKAFGQDYEFGFGFCWTVESREPQKTLRGFITRFEVPDSNLRPISGVPVNEEVTEEVTA
ncbi:hypothetical protein [Paraburkholderia sp.]|uniref:hypothetical protein n=1 Tax=Paraburkholderia sp. TaxID=1926495 RepID=UPI003C7CAF72